MLRISQPDVVRCYASTRSLRSQRDTKEYAVVPPYQEDKVACNTLPTTPTFCSKRMGQDDVMAKSRGREAIAALLWGSRSGSLADRSPQRRQRRKRGAGGQEGPKESQLYNNKRGWFASQPQPRVQTARRCQEGGTWPQESRPRPAICELFLTHVSELTRGDSKFCGWTPPAAHN
jgi:hypothetical protein